MSALLEAEYVAACAVFSRPVRFVEWKTLVVDSPETPRTRKKRERDKDLFLADWYPITHDKRLTGAWKEIEGDRWIYVFRRDALGDFGSANWVDELFVSNDGKPKSSAYRVSAVPMRVVPFRHGRPHEQLPTIPERGVRTAAKPLKSGPRFARRVNGKAQAHFFFATRIRLPAAAIAELQESVADWAIPTIFENDPHVIEDGDEVVVPVFDPLTIAMHLHDYFAKAHLEYLDYAVPHAELEPSERAKVKSRLEKALLARFLDDIVSAPDVSDRTYADVVQSFKDEDAFRAFLRDYDAQIGYRARWRDKWGTYLANWLGSAPILFLSRAHFHDVAADADAFLVPFLYCIPLSTAAPAMRNRLDAILDPQGAYGFFHRWVTPTQPLSGDDVQAVRKSATATIEALKTIVPIYLNEPAIRRSLINASNYLGRVIPINGKFVDFNVEERRIVEVMNTLRARFPDHGFEFAVQHLRAPPGANPIGMLAVYGHPDEETAKALRAQGRPAEHYVFGLQLQEASGSGGYEKPHPKGEGAKHVLVGLVGLVELFNVYFAIASLREAYAKDADWWGGKSLAWINLTGAVVDLVALPVSLVAESVASRAAAGAAPSLVKRVASKLVIVSAAIDVLLASVDAYQAISRGNGGVAVGDAVIVVGTVAALLAPVLGLAIVFLGYEIKLGFTPSPLESFCRHCEWGKDAYDGADYQGWRGRYDLQLSSLLELLVEISIEPDLYPRWAIVKVPWLPEHARIEVEYFETWLDETHRLVQAADLTRDHSPFDPRGPAVQLEISGTNGLYSIRPSRASLPSREPVEEKPYVARAVANAYGLRSIEYSVLFRLDFGGSVVTIPASAANAYPTRVKQMLRSGVTKQVFP